MGRYICITCFWSMALWWYTHVGRPNSPLLLAKRIGKKKRVLTWYLHIIISPKGGFSPLISCYIMVYLTVSPCGSVSKPCTPGEHQNSWYMDVHPIKNGIDRYWSIPMCIFWFTKASSPALASALLLWCPRARGIFHLLRGESQVTKQFHAFSEGKWTSTTKKRGLLTFLQLILLQEKHILLQDPMLCQELEMLLMMMMMMMVTYDDGNGDDDSWVMIHDCGLLDWSWEVLDFPLKNSKQNLNAGWLTVPWGWQTSYSPNGISFVWAPSKNHWCWHYSVRGNNMDVSLRYQYIYMILIVILDALQQKNVYGIWMSPFMAIYWRIQVYTHPRVTQKRSWHLARLVKASKQGKYIIPISGCELQIVVSKWVFVRF